MALSKPIAVIISDVHYSVSTLNLADQAMRLAINKANELQVPLIVAGDLHDTKANMRAECVIAMRRTFKMYDVTDRWDTEEKLLPFVLVGNHDLINEKSKDNALAALEPLIELVSTPQFTNSFAANGMSPWFLPYFSEPAECRKALSSIDKGSLVIMHQGLTGSNSGEYIQDHSAITHDDVVDFRVISGHYHTRQDIKTGRPRQGAVGLWSYIGNPYTLNFAEANDPEKGFRILNDDGTLDFVPTNLRKHVVYDTTTKDLPTLELRHNVGDLVLYKIRGTKEELSNLKNKPENCRLELIPTDQETRYTKQTQTMTQNEILDDIIDSKQDLSEDKKTQLKTLWKNL